MEAPRKGAVARSRIIIVMIAMCLAAIAPASAQETSAGRPVDVQLREARLFLEIVVNGVATGQICPFESRGGRLFARAADLLAAGVRIPDPHDAQVALDAIADVSFAYDSHRQRLEITIPVDWLPAHRLGETRLQARVPALASFGGVLNYDVHATAPVHGRGHLAVWTEQRLFDTWGSISNTGLMRRTWNRDTSSIPYLRYETRWSHTNEDRLLTVTAGDLVTAALPWTSAVRLGGMLVERNFSVRPDIVTYPVPEFAGQAAVPTAIDLFINGSQAVSDTVAPGPFVVTTVPIVEGAGRATVVTTDVLGRQRSETVTFYVASSLLRKGLADYSLSAGLMRRAFGVESWSYGRPAASGVARYGLTDYLTVAGHAEGGDRLGTAGAGADLRLHVFGVVGAAVAHGAHPHGRGEQYSASYSYTTRRYSVMLRHQQRAAGFTDLTTYDLPAGAVSRLARRVDQVTGAASPAFAGGTVGAGYFAVTQADGGRVRLVNVSFSRRLALGMSAYFSTSRRLDRAERPSVQIQIVRQIGHRGSLTASAADRGDSTPRGRVQYSRSVPPGGGLGWTAGYTPASGGHRQADLTWRTRHAQLQGGLYGTAETTTRWAGASGSLIVIGREVATANRVDDAFALVETGHYPHVPVLFENQFVGRTNQRGRLLVPWVSAYYAAKVAIDPLALPSGVGVPIIEQRVAVRRRSGAVIHFPVVRTLAALVTLVDDGHRPLPLGLTVTHAGSGRHALIGWDGQTYFENLAERNLLRVSLPDGRTCTAAFVMAPDEAETRRIGPLTCRADDDADPGP